MKNVKVLGLEMEVKDIYKMKKIVIVRRERIFRLYIKRLEMLKKSLKYLKVSIIKIRDKIPHEYNSSHIGTEIHMFITHLT